MDLTGYQIPTFNQINEYRSYYFCSPVTMSFMAGEFDRSKRRRILWRGFDRLPSNCKAICRVTPIE